MLSRVKTMYVAILSSQLVSIVDLLSSEEKSPSRRTSELRAADRMAWATASRMRFPVARRPYNWRLGGYLLVVNGSRGFHDLQDGSSERHGPGSRSSANALRSVLKPSLPNHENAWKYPGVYDVPLGIICVLPVCQHAAEVIDWRSWGRSQFTTREHPLRNRLLPADQREYNGLDSGNSLSGCILRSARIRVIE